MFLVAFWHLHPTWWTERQLNGCISRRELEDAGSGFLVSQFKDSEMTGNSTQRVVGYMRGFQLPILSAAVKLLEAAV